MGAFPASLRGLSRSYAALWLLVASLAFPALGAAEPEGSPTLVKRSEGSAWSRLFGRASDSRLPWAVEAPGAAGARFGLGLDLFSEHQESLRITFMEQSLQTRDLLTGAEENEVVRTDPGLLNRKFDFRLDLTGAGIQPAVALRLPRALGFYPTLTFQAAAADVSLDFLDLNRPGDSSSLSGRGVLFGAGLDLTRSLCRSCPWFAGASYFSQHLPSFSVGQSPGFSAPGFEVLEDDVRLRRDVQEASTRVGYGFSGQAVSYVGVRHRWTDVKIDDHLRYRDPFQEAETTLDSRTRLESEVTLALAGVEARLGPRLFGRLETSVGGGDWGVLLRMVYLPRFLLKEPERLTKEDSARIGAQIRRISDELAASINDLPEAVELEVVYALLNRFERRLLDVLPFPDFAAMRDYVQDQFQKAREALAREAAAATTAFPRIAPAAFRSSAPLPAGAALQGQAVVRKSESSILKTYILDPISLLAKRFEDNDIDVDLCVRSVPVQGATVKLYPLSFRRRRPVTSNASATFRRGLYGYEVDDYKRRQCENSEDCPLDLLTEDNPFVECVLSGKAVREASCTVKRVPSSPWECESDER